MFGLYDELVAAIKAAHPTTIYPRISARGLVRYQEVMRLLDFEPVPVVREIKGKRLWIAILTKGLRK